MAFFILSPWYFNNPLISKHDNYQQKQWHRADKKISPIINKREINKILYISSINLFSMVHNGVARIKPEVVLLAFIPSFTNFQA